MLGGKAERKGSEDTVAVRSTDLDGESGNLVALLLSCFCRYILEDYSFCFGLRVLLKVMLELGERVRRIGIYLISP